MGYSHESIDHLNPAGMIAYKFILSQIGFEKISHKLAAVGMGLRERGWQATPADGFSSL
jgi:hypothetical protein